MPAKRYFAHGRQKRNKKNLCVDISSLGVRLQAV